MKEFKSMLKETRKLNVLYVEDDEQMRDSALDMFSNFFASVSVAGDGREALEKLSIT